MDPSLEPTSKILVQQARSGDAASMEVLVERHLPGLRAYLRLKAGSMLLAKESSSDLAQSVCRDLLQNTDGMRCESEGQFRSWLYTTALRKIADRYEYYSAQKRNVARERSGSTGDLLKSYATFCTPSQQASAREQLSLVEDAFVELPDEHQQVILLAKIVGLSRVEIGREMNRSEGAVRALLCRALANLADVLRRRGA